MAIDDRCAPSPCEPETAAPSLGRRALRRARGLARRGVGYFGRRARGLARRVLHPARLLKARLRKSLDTPIALPDDESREPQWPIRVGAPRVPSARHFRVLFVLKPGVVDAACMRYRGFNVIEALRLAGTEADFLDERQIPRKLARALGFDLIVLVRRELTPEVALLLEGTERFNVPVIFDLDDYLWDEEIIPHVEMLRHHPIENARRFVGLWRGLMMKCHYYTGSTPYLVEQAARAGRDAFLIRNGLNEAQLALSREAYENERQAPARPGPRLGYLSGTRTHQDDFRLIAPALLALMTEFPTVELVVAGDFDMSEFPEFRQFADRVEERPFVDWRLLPPEIARLDVNLIPLVINTFTEGKSNLKYYEAALLKVPSVASPTRVYEQSITHGINGFLARSAEEWYEILRSLIIDPALRNLVGERAYRHVLREYVPENIANEALTSYRRILTHHRARLSAQEDAPSVVVLLSDLGQAVRDREPVLSLAREMATSGAGLTILLPGGQDQDDAATGEALQVLCGDLPAPFVSIQVGGEVPCCDILLATDAVTAHRANRSRHRARWAAYLVSDYEPASLPSSEEREIAAKSYQLGLDLLALDPLIATRLESWHNVKAIVLPAWVERPAAPATCLYPQSVLVVGTRDLSPRVWEEAADALRELHTDHPEIRVFLAGGAAFRSEELTIPLEVVSALNSPEFEEVVSAQPVCLVLSTTGRPRWMYDLMAAGCPIVTVGDLAEPTSMGPEAVEGFISVAADASSIAVAVDSLLIDRVRLGRLTSRAAERVAGMPTSRESTDALLGTFEWSETSTVAPPQPSRSIYRGPIAKRA